MINEAAFIKMEGVSDIAGIDTAMKLGANHPMGPLELGDFIGLDICLAIMDVLYKMCIRDRSMPSAGGGPMVTTTTSQPVSSFSCRAASTAFRSSGLVMEIGRAHV